MASLLRRDHSSVQGADLRSAMQQPPETYDLTTEKVRKEQKKEKRPPLFTSTRVFASTLSMPDFSNFSTCPRLRLYYDCFAAVAGTR